jgi:hypothetical protein
MSFIRAKEIPPRSGNWYDYEVENHRVKGQVRQTVIKYIGKSGTVSNPARMGHRDYRTPDPSTSILTAPPKLKVVCKFCGGQHTRKYGQYKGVQNYYCTDCDTKF